MAKKNIIEKGVDAAQDVALIGVGQAVTAELVEALSEALAKEGETPGILQQFGVKAVVPLVVGAGTAGATKNKYARNVGIGMAATGGVNGVRLVIDYVKEKMASDDTESTVSGAARRLAAQRQVRALPAANNWNVQQTKPKEEERDSGLLGAGSSQYTRV